MSDQAIYDKLQCMELGVSAAFMESFGGTAARR